MADNLSKTKRTSQAMDNFSFDETYLQNTQLVLTEENNTLIRQPKIATESTLQSLVAASGGGFALVKRDYSGEDLIYKGTNTSATALDEDTTWSITKYTYVGGVETEAKTLTGSWTGRAALFE